MKIWIKCPQFHWIGVWMTHMPSIKIPKRDSRSCVSKTSVNSHKIIEIRLDNTSKQGLMHEHVGKRAKMQRSKESQTGGTKQERKAQRHQTKWRKVCFKHTNIREMCLTSGHIQQATKGVDATMQASGPKTNKHKPTEGIKHGKAQMQTGKHGDKAQQQASKHV